MAWTHIIINGPGNPEDQPQEPVQNENTGNEQDDPNNEQQEEQTQEPVQNGNKELDQDDPNNEQQGEQPKEPILYKITENKPEIAKEETTSKPRRSERLKQQNETKKLPVLLTMLTLLICAEANQSVIGNFLQFLNETKEKPMIGP